MATFVILRHPAAVGHEKEHSERAWKLLQIAYKSEFHNNFINFKKRLVRFSVQEFGCQLWGRYRSMVAQMAEQATCDQEVLGSNPYWIQ